MNINVCVKAVRAEYAGSRQQNDNSLVLNPYDLFALKSALEQRKNLDLHIRCLSMGPSTVRDALVKCYIMGADQVVLLNDPAFAGSDTVATSYILSAAISKLGASGLTVFGGKSVDSETGQVPGGVAERLGIRYISDVTQIIKMSGDDIVLETSNESYCAVVKAAFPAVISFCEFSTEVHTSSLIELKRAMRKEIISLGASDIDVDPVMCGARGSKTRVLEVTEAFEKRSAIKMMGRPMEEAATIRDILMGTMR